MKFTTTVRVVITRSDGDTTVVEDTRTITTGDNPLFIADGVARSIGGPAGVVLKMAGGMKPTEIKIEEV